MSKLPIISGKNLIRILSKIGYCKVRQRGSHIRLACHGRKSATVPDYKTIDRYLLKKILRDAELTVEEFINLYRE
ncbi:type II toxin-antitoxin system HicA family toxin [Patescibacteria group bacterium]|nr:type II toxin-antitoxin system HicA family toxin [Patescibacteria group bacterium]MBU4000146.1 type II toxin-antitoxin system HicA family toxin [Patescibacteria group bacterium]MBU4056535.1 type II toxin-antitoxin system HicA family toxin [Patescibacteria group bacterium]MBU4368950.1 type II toxin-antitoxin system HicA family toxin [Patescibacteria group bacterium]